MDNSIVQLLEILVASPRTSQGFELPENEYEQYQQRRHEALRELATMQQSNPAIFHMFETINGEMPSDGGTRDQVLRAAKWLAASLLPKFRSAQIAEAGITNHERLLREAAKQDPFLEGANLTRDAYAGQGEVEPDTWSKDANLKRRL